MRYYERNPESLTKGLDLIEKEVPYISAFNLNELGVKEIESYINNLDKNKEVNRVENIVNKNVEGISRIAIYDTPLLNYLALIKKTANHTCLFTIELRTLSYKN